MASFDGMAARPRRHSRGHAARREIHGSTRAKALTLLFVTIPSFGDANEAPSFGDADTGTDYLRILDFNRVCKKYK